MRRLKLAFGGDFEHAKPVVEAGNDPRLGWMRRWLQMQLETRKLSRAELPPCKIVSIENG